MITKTSILQWNIRGVHNKKQEIIQLIDQCKASVIALQETLMPANRLHKIPGYSVIGKDGVHNFRQHGGVAIYIHSDIPFEEIALTSPLQAVAATIQLRNRLTLCNVYNSRSHNLSANLLNQLYSELPKPCIILGDFNAYSPLWGCASSDTRGNIIASFLENSNLVLLNNGAPTHPNQTADTAIDLTFSSPEISEDFEWNTIPSVFDSDHFPITLSTELTEPNPFQIRLLKKANWDIYKGSSAWNNLPQELGSNEEVLQNLYDRINTACDDAIPKTTPSKFFPKPWWTPELTESRNRRERFYKIHRRKRTPQDAINWRRARAQHKNLVRQCKEKSWREYISDFNEEMPISELCKRVRKMKGIPPKSIRIICNDDQPPVIYSTPTEIAEILAKTFAEVSSNNNYVPEFLPRKLIAEQNMPNFGNLNCPYNSTFKIHELEHILSKVKDTTPGEDGVVYKMIRNMPIHAKEYLIKIFNKFYSETYFPPLWGKSLIIPVLKPDKNPNSSKSYRPIALTSCLCKLMERLISERLMEYFIMHRILTPAQSGGVRNRSTVDHLVKLEDSIRTAFASQEHYISVFFDLERAYDMTWRKGIVLDLHRIGMRGLLPKFIAVYLEERKFKVKVGKSLSNEHEQQNGVPQGAVLSVLLFALKINDIVKNLPSAERFTCSLFVDDLQIGYRHPDLNIIKATLQRELNNLHSWTRKNGFKFSNSKTQVVHYTKLRGIHLPPELKLGNEILQYSNHAKFLGLTFDSKLNWNIHLARLKNDCQKLLGIMKMLTSLKYGATQESLMRIFRIYIRSKLDYGSIVYSSANPRNLATLDVVSNDALRIAIGAFKSSPIESLYALTNEMTPTERRNYLSIRYFLKIKASLHNPTNKCITNRNETLFRNHQEAPFFIRVANLLSTYNFTNFNIKPDFSYLIHNCTTPKYALSDPITNIELAKLPKSTTDPTIYKTKFLEMRSRKYSNFSEIFTDGSKSSDGVGSAAVSSRSSCVASLPKEASIFSAELHAIQMAVDSTGRRIYHQSDQQQNHVIYTDSKSSVDSLHIRNNHPVIRYIVNKLNTLKQSGINVEICWIPSHVGIQGNEAADQKAKEVAKRRAEIVPIHYEDYFSILRTKLDNKRKQNYQTHPRLARLRQINPNPSPWPTSTNTNRHEEIILSRIRLGHTNLTHSYLMENINPPICHFCNNSTLSILHIFTQCPQLEQSRRHHFRPLTTWNPRELLGINADESKILGFLKAIQIFNSI